MTDGERDLDEEGAGRGFDLAAIGTTVYLVACCLILPAAFGSAALSAGALFFGAPGWLVLGLGAIAVALGSWYIGQRL